MKQYVCEGCSHPCTIILHEEAIAPRWCPYDKNDCNWVEVDEVGFARVIYNHPNKKEDEGIHALCDNFYSTQKPIDFSKGSIVDRYIAKKMNVSLEEILNSPFCRPLIVDWNIKSYLEGKAPDKDTGKYIWECPEDLKWYENEKRKEGKE